jgi:hypothetical protein
MTSFNIGSQSAGNISNVGGDQHVHGDQHGISVNVDDARSAARQLRRALDTAALDMRTATVGLQSMDKIETELAREVPNPDKVASVLRHLTESLTAAGALAAAATGLSAPLTTIATWLGSLGAPVLQLLHR